MQVQAVPGDVRARDARPDADRIVTQYATADGWPEHLSSRSRYAGDWDPWIIWVALGGAVFVAIAGFRAYLDRQETEAEVEREIERMTKTR